MNLRPALSVCWSGFLDREGERLALWLPVFMGIGVLIYFALRFEPPIWTGAVIGVPTLACMFVPPLRGAARYIGFPILALVLGFAAGQFATYRSKPIETDLPTRATIVSGTLRAVEILPAGRRVTVEHASLDGSPVTRLRTIRVRLRKTDTGPLATGDTIRVRALVRPPAPPSYPGGWDLQRDAFYAGLGASGYAIGPVERLTEAIPSGPARLLQRLREIITHRITAVIPGAAGAVCVTLLTGGQTGIPEAEHAAFRDSGLAHLLAVAGLHIGIVMGFAMGLTRLLFACSERASLFWPTKALAALIALAVGGFYMVLTGMHVPIVRSFLMACLFTLGIVAGRRVVSLRGLALAGVVLMLTEPNEVPGVSFQMSFSAVLALISGYEALRPWLRELHGKSLARRFASHVVALALTSALAGTASAPYGAYHFGHIQLYFVIANMIAVPLTALWVMPAGLIALMLMPLGLESLVLVPMGWGAQAIIWVGQTASSWPMATLEVPHMPGWGLAILSLGLAWLGIWRGRMRLLGLMPILFGILSPALERPPDVLISADGRLLGFHTPSGVFLQQIPGASKFVREAWMQYWAAGAVQALPVEGEAAGGAIRCRHDYCHLTLHNNPRTVLLIRGPTRPEGCNHTAVIVSAEPARGLCPRPWPLLVDRFTVWREGAAAIWLTPGTPIIVTDRAMRGARPWVPPPPVAKPRPPPGLPPATIDEVSAPGIAPSTAEAAPPASLEP